MTEHISPCLTIDDWNRRKNRAPQVLYRYFDTEYYAYDLVKRGMLRVPSLAAIKKQDDVLGDPGEGVEMRSLSVVVRNGILSGNPLHVQHAEALSRVIGLNQNSNLMLQDCLFQVNHHLDGYCVCYAEQLWDKIFRHKMNRPYVVRITNPMEFMLLVSRGVHKRFASQKPACKTDCGIAPVFYQDAIGLNEQDVGPFFRKSREFVRECEFRQILTCSEPVKNDTYIDIQERALIKHVEFVRKKDLGVTP